MRQVIIEGQYRLGDLPVKSRQWAPANYERRYWDIIEVEDEEDLAAYLSGQQDFIPEKASGWLFEFGQEAKQERKNINFIHLPPEHHCARCKRVCKPQYTYCYRCNSYLKVKEKLAKGA